MQTEIRLNQLRSGAAYPGAPVNMRSTGKTEDIDRLAAMIAAEISADNPTGLLQNLLVCPGPKNNGNGKDVFYVVDGDRRLAALNQLAGDKFPKDMPVPVTLLNDVTPGSAMARSIAANTYLPPHPIDRFEAFARLDEQGMSPDDIAARFGVSVKLVKQSLALGKLSPKIRQEWRDDKINAETAQAFTLSADHAVQDRAYDTLKKSHNLWARSVKDALTGGQNERTVNASLAFIGGKKAYLDAGGTIVEDLFGSAKFVSDSELLNRLVLEKLTTEIDRYKAEGWSFVLTLSEVGNDSWQYSKLAVKEQPTKDEAAKIKKLVKKIDSTGDANEGEQLESELEELLAAIRLRSFTDAHKAKSGVIIGVDQDGDLYLEIGVVKPREEKKQVYDTRSGRMKDKPVKKPGDLSWQLKQDLSEGLTDAAAAVVGKDQQFALSCAIAAMASGHSPVRIKVSGRVALDGYTVKFETKLAEALAMTPAQRLEALALLVGGSLDLTVRAIENYHDPVSDKSVAALAEAVDGAKLNKALRAMFHPADFFTRASGVRAEQACDDIGMAKPKGKKADIAAAVAAEAKKTGWLPKELRTKHYDGPGAGGPSKKATTAKAKVTAKPKAATPKRRKDH